MTTKDYFRAAQEMRAFTKDFRDELGRKLIADMKRAWDRGDTQYIIPPGAYNVYGPIPIPGKTTKPIQE